MAISKQGNCVHPKLPVVIKMGPRSRISPFYVVSLGYVKHTQLKWKTWLLML